MVSSSVNTTYGIVERNLSIDLLDIHLPMVSASVNTTYGIVERYFEPNNITRQYLSDYPNFSWLSFNGLANIQSTDTSNPISYNIGTAESPVFIGPHSTDLVINLNAYTSVEDGETKSIKIIPPGSGQLAHGDILGLDGNNTIAGTTITYRPDNNSKEVDSFSYVVIGTVPETGLSMESNVSTCFVETSHRERQYVSTGNAFNSLGFASSLVLSIPDQESPLFSSYTVPDIDKNITKPFRIPAATYETIAITEQPMAGVLTYFENMETTPKTGPYFTYQPAPDTPVDFDDDVFTFTVKLMGVDPTVSYTSSQFTLRVKNTPPQVDNDFSVLIQEDSDTGYVPLPISGVDSNGLDVNGDLIYSEIVPTFGDPAVAYPQNGTAVLSSNSLQYKYTPNLHWHGSDKFYYKSKETTNSIWSETKEIQIQVDSVYDSPQATVLTGGVSDEGGYIAYTMVGTSNEFAGDYDLRYQLIQNPTENGTIVGHFTNTTNENVLAVGEDSALLTSPIVEIHADDTDYFGTGTWKYRVVDINRTLNGSLLADANSSIVECSYLFNDVNDAPTAVALNVNVNEDQLTQIDLSFNDAYNETGSYSYTVTQPSGPNAGILSGGCMDYPASSFVNYLSKSNYVGTDTFTYIVNDGALNSAAASVTVNVLNTPDAPVADNLTVVVVEDSFVNFTVPHIDVDPGEESDLRVFWAEVPPENRGLITIPNGEWNSPGVLQYTFTPSPHNTISTFADYYLWDGTWIDSSESMEVGDDGNPVAASWSNARTSGQGRITFNITEHDDLMEWVAHPTTMSVQEQQTGDPATYNTIDIQAIDPDVLGSNILTGQAPSYSIKTQGSKGVATIAPVSGTDTWRITYTLNDVEYTQNTTDTFTYRATNSTNPEITEVCTVTIYPLDDMPTFTASPINIACTEVEGFTFDFADYIVDPDSTAFDIVKFEYVITDAPNFTKTGTWNPSGLGWDDPNMPTVTYNWDDINHQLSDSSVTQTDSFKWKVRDQSIGSGYSDEVTVNITIQGVNSAPVITAAPTALELYEDTISYFTFTATDAESTPIVYTFSQPDKGVVAATTGSDVMSGTHKYTPPADYFGNPGTFTMSASDGVNTTTTSNITINVISVNDHPIAESQSLGTNEDVALSITLTGHDHPNKQGEDSPITFKDVSAPANGILTEHSSFSTNGIITYTPNQDYHGADSFTFKVNDGTNDSVAATITLAVHDINDPPIATPQTISGGNRPSEGGVKSITLAGTDVENNPLAFYLHDVLPQHGSLHPSETAATNGTNAYSAYQLMANPVWYKHDDSENHTDTFNFRARESETSNQYYSTNPALVTINIIPVNDAPVASAQSVTVEEDSVDNVITLTTYATDVDADDTQETLTYIINGQPSYGIIDDDEINSTQKIEYTPNANFNGNDVITFKANDGTTDSNTASISITVTPVDDSPFGTVTNWTGTEDTSLILTLNATDIDTTASGLVFEIVSIPGNITLLQNGLTKVDGAGGAIVAGDLLSGTSHTLIASPDTNWNGTNTFKWKVNDDANDADGWSSDITETIQIDAVNDPPVATDLPNIAVMEDASIAITLVGTDDEGDTLTYHITNMPLKGSLSDYGNTSSSVTYTPTIQHLGYDDPETSGNRETETDTFKYKVNDGTVDSLEATVTITISGVNDPPVATDFTLSNATTGTTNYNESGLDQFDWFPVPMSNRGSDVDSNDGLWYEVVSIPTGSKIQRLRTDGTNYDIWNSATVASSGVVLWSGSAHSSYEQLFDWQPNDSNWSGTETLTYRALDSGDGSPNDPEVPGDDRYSENATITIIVAATGDTPTTTDQVVNYTEDTPISFSAIGNDPDFPYGDYVKSVTIHEYAANWGASLLTIPDAEQGKSLNWTFNRNIENDYANTYVDWSFIDSNDVQSNQSRINFNGIAVEEYTVWETYPTNNTVSGNENTGSSIVVTATDADDSVTYGIEEQLIKTSGTASGNPTLTHSSSNSSGAFSISAVPNANGSWYGTCKVFAEGSNKLVKTITVNLFAVNETPVAIDATYDIEEDEEHAVDLDDLISDEETADGGLTITHTNPGHGTVSIDANTHIATFTPAQDNYTDTSYTYTVSDGSTSVTKTINYTITSVNDLPTASTFGMSNGNYLASVDEDETIDVYLMAEDVETSNLTYSITSNPAHYSIWAHQGGNHWKYRGASNNNDNIQFGWKVTDAHGGEATADGHIQINPVADTVAWLTGGDYTVTIPEDGSNTVQRGAQDPDGTGIDYSVVYEPPNGTLVGNGLGAWLYTPNANFNSSNADIGRIKAVSGGDTIYKYMKYTVYGVDDIPVAINQSVSVAEDSFVDITLTGSDVEGQSLSFGNHSTPSHGSLSNFSGAGVRYTPTGDYAGSDSFTFTVSTSFPSATSTPATVSITVTPQNDAPVAYAVSADTDEDTAVVITLNGSDPVEGSSVSYHKVTDPSHGSVGNITDNSITYTPTSDYNGNDSFTYKVNDGNLDSDSATVYITVDPVADNPTANLNDFSVDEDGSVTVPLAGIDPDAADSALDGYMTNHGGYGTFVVSSNKKELTFEPYANSNTNTWFSYYVKSAVSTGSRQSSVRTVNITVDPVEDDPNVSTHDWGTVYRGSTYTATLTAGDVDGNYSHAVPTNKVSTLTVDENDDFGATISGSIVTAYDNLGNTASNYATGTVGNRTPTATAQSLTTGYGEALAITLDSSDLDPGEDHDWTIVSDPSDGSVSTPTNAGVTIYSPGVGHYGEATFTWKVVDAAGNSSSTVTCTVDTDPPPDINPPNLVTWNQSIGNLWTTSTASLTFSFTGEAGWDVTSFTSWANGSEISTSIASGAIHATRNGTWPTAAVSQLVKMKKVYRQSNKHENTTSLEAAWRSAAWLARPPYPGPPPVDALTGPLDPAFAGAQNNPIGGGDVGLVLIGYSQTVAQPNTSYSSPWSIHWGDPVWTGLGSPISASIQYESTYVGAILSAPGTGGIQGPRTITFSHPWSIKLLGAAYSSGTISFSTNVYYY